MSAERVRRVDVGTLGLSVLEEGSGPRHLLIVHGFCGAKENYAALARRLADSGRHVVVPDLRGHGASDHPRGTDSYSFELFVADLVGLLDVLGWERFTLMGHSMGGKVAQLLALRDPGRVEALILEDTFHGRVAIDPEIASVGRKLVSEGGIVALVETMSQIDDPLETEAHRRLLEEDPGHQELLDAQSLACSDDMWLAMSEAFLTGDELLGRLEALDLPTLVVVGEQDKPFRGSSKRIAEAIPGARLEVITGAGHSPQLETPDAMFELLSAFLEKL